jgi:hypothetical protein
MVQNNVPLRRYALDLVSAAPQHYCNAARQGRGACRFSSSTLCEKVNELGNWSNSQVSRGTRNYPLAGDAFRDRTLFLTLATGIAVVVARILSQCQLWSRCTVPAKRDKGECPSREKHQ